jgi:hypothetical protein
MELLKRVLVWVLTLIFALCLSPTTSAQTNTSVLNGELPGGMGSPSPQRFNTVSCQSFSMWLAWDPQDRGPVHVSLIYEGSLVVLYSNTFYGGYGSFTVNYFPYPGYVHIFVSNFDNLYYLNVEGTISLWYQ